MNYTSTNKQEIKLFQACEDPVALSKLTDDWINQTIRNSSNPELERARNIMKRIDDREKYKYFTDYYLKQL